MAVLHKEFTDFNKEIELTNSRKEKLQKSINEIERKILDYFNKEKPNEVPPSFQIQGSLIMGTAINPIPLYDIDDKKILHYDLDNGVYFKGNEDEYHKSIDTLHSWISNATNTHTDSPNKGKTTCVRVVFADGHHIDLPIYYQNINKTYLAHRSKGWIESKPVEFADWFNKRSTRQLKRIVRYLKAWKNNREVENSNLKFPSGFALTILATNNYHQVDNDDEAFLNTIQNIYDRLENKFECLRPTTPIGENIFEDFSETRKNDFIKNLKNLVKSAKKASKEENYQLASKHFQKHFGERFPLGRDKKSDSHKVTLNKVLASSKITPKPFAHDNKSEFQEKTIRNRENLQKEIEEVIKDNPNLVFDKLNNCLTGKLELKSIDDSYSIKMDLHNFPNRYPIVYELNKRIPQKVERHVYPKTGNLCLTFPEIEKLYLSMGKIKTLQDFIELVLKPYLINNTYFEENHRYKFGEYSHDYSLATIEAQKDLHNLMLLELKNKMLNDYSELKNILLKLKYNKDTIDKLIILLNLEKNDNSIIDKIIELKKYSNNRLVKIINNWYQNTKKSLNIS